MRLLFVALLAAALWIPNAAPARAESPPGIEKAAPTPPLLLIAPYQAEFAYAAEVPSFPFAPLVSLNALQPVTGGEEVSALVVRPGRTAFQWTRDVLTNPRSPNC